MSILEVIHLYGCYTFQTTVAHNAKGLSSQMKSVQKVPTYQIQGMSILHYNVTATCVSFGLFRSGFQSFIYKHF